VHAKAFAIGIVVVALAGGPLTSRATVTTQHCIVSNPGTTSCTVVFSTPVRDITWTVLAPGGTWRLCYTSTANPAQSCWYSWQFSNPPVTFQDDAALNNRFVKVTLQVLGRVVDGRRRGFGIVGSEPLRPLCVPYLHHSTFCL